MSGPRRFVKMSGAGNDFVVLGPDESRALGGDAPAWARLVCRRGLSVGADGVLLVEPSSPGSVHVTFLNPDGEKAFCGNGSRCAARFAFLHGMADRALTLETALGPLPAEVFDDVVRVALPPPDDLGERSIEALGSRFEGRLVAAGVPHYVVIVSSLDDAPLGAWGPALRRHPAFGPAGANVDLVEERGGRIAIRTFERGVEAETLSCGSGAVAAAWVRRAEFPGGVIVVPRSGIALRVEFAGPRERPTGVVLEGDARVVFEGELSEEAPSGWRS